MDRFGQYLREAREEKNISLQAICDSTRISVRMLEALENERFDQLPGGVFTISFVRQYAEIVGLDENEAVARLKEVAHPVERALGQFSEQSTRQADDTGAKLAELFTDFVRRNRLTLAGAAVTVLLLAGGMAFFEAYEDAESQQASQPAVKQEPPRSQTVPPATSPSTSGPTEPRQVEVASREEGSGQEPPAAKPGGNEKEQSIRLELQLTERAWVRVVADGERVLEDNLDAGFAQTIQAQESVTLVVGNAGGVTVAVNGEDRRPVGPHGHVRRVDVSASGMEVVNVEPEPSGEGDRRQPPETEI